MNDFSFMGEWFSQRFHIFLALFANTMAWGQSFSSGNLNVAVIVTICTVAVPAIVGAIRYSMLTLGPVCLKQWIDYQNARNSTLGGQIERLMGQLEMANAVAESQKELTDNAKESARLAKEMAADQAKVATEQARLATEQTNRIQVSLDEAKELQKELQKDRDKQIANLTQLLEESRGDSRRNLQKISDSLAEAQHRAEVAESDRLLIQEKLNQALRQIRENSEPIRKTAEKISDMADAAQRVVEAAQVMTGEAHAEMNDIDSHPNIRIVKGED